MNHLYTLLTNLSAETLPGVDTQAISDALTEAATGASGGFHPWSFVENLRYMGLGMLGIFIVTGAIILVILLLSKLTSGKKKDDDHNE